MTDPHIITPQLANSFLATPESIDLSSYTLIEDEAALLLSQHSGKHLDLSGISELSDTSAQYLSEYSGQLKLSDLTTKKAIQSLTNNSGQVQLAINRLLGHLLVGLPELNDQIGKELVSDNWKSESTHSTPEYLKAEANTVEPTSQRLNIIALLDSLKQFRPQLNKGSLIKLSVTMGILFGIIGFIYWELSSSQRWNERGVEALTSEDLPVAEASFNRAIKDDPENMFAYRNLGVLYKIQGDLDAAQLCLQKALSINPDYADAAFELGTVLRSQGLWDEAIVQISSSILSGFDQEKAYYERARCYQSRKAEGDIQNAINDFSRVVKINPRNGKAYFFRATEYRNRGESKKAIADATAAISINSQDAEYHKFRGILYIEAKEFERAVNDFDKALQILPDSPELLELRAKAQADRAHTPQALKDLDRVIELRPSASSFLLRAKIHLSLDSYSLASSDAAKSIYYDPQNPEAYRIKGLAESRNGNYKDAIKSLTIAASSGSASYEILMARGVANFNLRNFGEAVEDFGSCIYLEASQADGHTWRAKSYLARKQFDFALDDLDKAIDISPSSELHAMRASTHSELGQFTYAIEDYSAAIKLDNKQPLYHLERGKVYLQQNALVKSYDDFTTVIALDPKNIEALEKRADLGFRLKKYQESINDWSLYLALSTAATNGFIGRARSYLEIMHYEEAINDLNFAVSIDSTLLPQLARELAECHQHLAATLESEKQYQKALSHLDNADKIFPEGTTKSDQIRWNCYLRLGHEVRDKNPLGAIVYYTKSISVNSKQHEAFHARGLLYGDLQEWEKSLSDLSAALREKVHDPEILLARGKVFLALKQFDKASGDFSDAILVAAQNQDALLGRAESNFSLGKYDSCITDLLRAKELSKKLSATHKALLVNAYVKYASHLFDSGKYAAALENIDNAIENDPKVLQATKELQAESNYQLGLLEKSNNSAIEYFNQALAITEDHIPARLARAKKLIELPKVQEGTDDFQYVVSAPNATHSEKMEAYWSLAKLAVEFSDSRKYFDFALRLARETSASELTSISLDYAKRISEDKAAELEDLFNAIGILQTSKAPEPKLNVALSEIYEKLAQRKLSLIPKEDKAAAKELELIINYFMFAIDYSPIKEKSLTDIVNSTRQNRSKILVRLGEFSEAINELETVMRNSNPLPELLKHELADAYNWMGFEQYNSGNWTNAINAFHNSFKMRPPTETDSERLAVAYGKSAAESLKGAKDGSSLGLLQLEKLLELTSNITIARELHQEISRQKVESAIDDALSDLSSRLSSQSPDVDISLRLPVPKDEQGNIRTNAFQAVKLMEQGSNEEAISKLSEVVNAGYPVAQVFYARAICFGLEGDNSRMDIDLEAGLFLESLGDNAGVGLTHGTLFMSIQNPMRIKLEEFRGNVTPTILDEKFKLRKATKANLLGKLNTELDKRVELFRIPVGN